VFKKFEKKETRRIFAPKSKERKKEETVKIA